MTALQIVTLALCVVGLQIGAGIFMILALTSKRFIKYMCEVYMEVTYEMINRQTEGFDREGS